MKQLLIQKIICDILDPKNDTISDRDLFMKIDAEMQRVQSAGVYRQVAQFLTQASHKQSFGGMKTTRYDLVSQLIEKEPSLVDQVRLYLDMKQYNKAMRKAYSAASEELVTEAFNTAINQIPDDCRMAIPQQDENETYNGLFRQLCTAESEQDTFPAFFKQFISRKVLYDYRMMMQHPKLQVKTNFTDPDLISRIGSACGDQQFMYKFKLQLYKVEC